MIGFELVCLAIVLFYVAVELPRQPDRARYLGRMGLVTAGSWLAEETCIRLYDFYSYNPDWTVFVGHVPLLVILIWAPVVMSAWGLARRLTPSAIPLVAAGFVLADAWLIEPISASAQLWRWHEPGLFAIPPIGVLGWAYFAGIAIATYEWLDRRGAPAVADLLVVPIAAVGSHVLLLATWWGALRWVNVDVPQWPAAVVAGVVSLGLTVWALRRGARARVSIYQMVTRIPGAALFFVLLARHGVETPALVAWAVAFAPPYLALTPWGALRRQAPALEST